MNPRPLVPQTSALTGLRHAPTGTARTIGPSATVDLISVSARMPQPYCKRPKRPLLAVSIFAMSGTVCRDVFEQMAVEKAKQVGWMLSLNSRDSESLSDSRVP